MLVIRAGISSVRFTKRDGKRELQGDIGYRFPPPPPPPSSTSGLAMKPLSSFGYSCGSSPGPTVTLQELFGAVMNNAFRNERETPRGFH